MMTVTPPILEGSAVSANNRPALSNRIRISCEPSLAVVVLVDTADLARSDTTDAALSTILSMWLFSSCPARYATGAKQEGAILVMKSVAADAHMDVANSEACFPACLSSPYTVEDLCASKALYRCLIACPP